jgi:hypothetical protein
MGDEHIDLLLDERWPNNSSLRFYATAFNSAGRESVPPEAIQCCRPTG